MFVRTLAAVALLLGLAFGPAAGQTPASAPKAPTSVSKSYRVEFRRAGSSAWSYRGVYTAFETARAEANLLFAAGHDVRVTKSETVTYLRTQPGIVPTPTPTPTPSPGRTPSLMGGISVVSFTQAVQMFRAAATRADIAFRYPTDGCYARAHLMALQFQRMGFRPGKAWAFADQQKHPRAILFATTMAHPKKYVTWGYHVAPALRVRAQDGKVYNYVIDPSLHDKPVTLGTWQRRMMHPRIGYTPRMEVTAWGVAPRDADGRRLPGSGYWPSADPPDLTRAALATMSLYKPHQGTAWVPPRRTVASRGLGSGDSPEDKALDLVPYAMREFKDKALLDELVK